MDFSEKVTKVRDLILLPVLFSVSLVIRIVSLFRTYMFSRDGTQYLEMAKEISDGTFSVGEYDYHPFYPIVIDLFRNLFATDWVFSGRMVSLLLSSLTVIPVFYITKSLFRKDAAVIAALFFAIHPISVKLSTDIISDPTYLFFFSAAVMSCIFLLERPTSLALCVTVGALSALSYLTRPEGIGVMVLICIWCFFLQRRRWYYFCMHRIPYVLLICVSFLIVVFPYLYGIRKATGQWEITTKKNISDWLSLGEEKKEFHLSCEDRLAIIEKGEQDRSLARFIAAHKMNLDTRKPLHENRDLLRVLVVEEALREGVDATAKKYLLTPQMIKVWTDKKAFILDRLVDPVKEEKKSASRSGSRKNVKALRKIIRSFIKVYHIFFLLLPLGILMRRIFPSYTKGEAFIATCILLFFYVLFRLFQIHYVSRRYTLPLAIIALPWAAAGLLELSYFIRRYSERLSKNIPAITQTSAALVLLCLFTLPLIPESLKSRGKEKLILREVGEWIQREWSPGAVILGGDSRVTYFARGERHVSLPSHKITMQYEDLVEWLRSIHGELLVADKKDLDALCPSFRKRAVHDARFVLLKIFPYEGGRHTFVLYQFLQDRP